MKKSVYILLTLLIGPLFYAQEKELPPEGSTPREFTIPEKEERLLNNGLKLVMIPYGNLPKATIRVSVATGNVHENKNQVWLADLMVNLLEEGSTSKNAKQIADEIAGMGGNLNIGIGQHKITFNTAVLSEFASNAIQLTADILLNPAWPEQEIERIKNNIKRDLSVQLSRPEAQANKAFFEHLYPNHPYGRVFTTPEMVDSFTLNDIKSFYKANIGAQRITVYVVGLFDKNQVIEAVEKSFNDMEKGPTVSYPKADPNQEVVATIIDRPEAPQSTIFYGLPVIDPSNKDYVALEITNSLLGGSFGSRITSNIREDKGYTYSPYSDLENYYRSSIWYEQADVTTKYTGASLKEINKEINTLRSEAPSQEELNGIKNYESGIFVLRNSSPRGMINQLEFLNLHGLNSSFLNDKIKNIQAVTPEKVKQVMNSYINPDKMSLIVVGDKSKIQNQVQEIVKTKKLKQ